MEYIKKLSNNPSFEQLGLNGYNLDLNTNAISVSIEDCFKGHDKYCTNTNSTHIYYVLEGEGKFKIDGTIYNVTKDDYIEIPANTKFIFAGTMKLLLIMTPPFNPQNDIKGEDNDLY